MLNPRWNDLDLVAEFAAREPDHRLVQLVEAIEHPERIRFLDLGCAAGRNAVWLSRRGCVVDAVDLSAPMIELTKERLAEVVGETEAARRTHRLPMTDLAPFSEDSFDVVVALGIHQQAASLEEWDLAMSETLRVMKSGALLLVAHFGVGTDLTGEHGQSAGAAHLYEIREGHPSILFTASELDERMESLGLEPGEPTRTVEHDHDPAGKRVTINGLYRKSV